MKKWLRRTLITALLVGLTLAVLYEAATHVGRGWLRGAAFYEGRPTSYWRGRIDEWVERFDSPKEAVQSIDQVVIGPVQHNAMSWPPPLPKSRPRTWMTSVVDVFNRDDAEGHEHSPPHVLWGWYNSESVLVELAANESHRPLAERALRNVKLVATIKNGGQEPTMYVNSMGSFRW